MASANAPHVHVSVQYNKPALEIVTKPFLVGDELLALSEAASRSFFATCGLDSFRGPVVALDILRGGRFYHMREAWAAASGGKSELPTAEVRGSRYQDADDGNKWKCRVHEETAGGLQLVRGARTVVIGDTVATGTTLAFVVEWLLEQRGAGAGPLDVHIFSIAGGDAAVPRLEALGARLEAAGGRLSLTYANCVFHLADNGTDLGFTGNAQWNGQARAEMEAVLGGFAEKMKCGEWPRVPARPARRPLTPPPASRLGLGRALLRHCRPPPARGQVLPHPSRHARLHPRGPRPLGGGAPAPGVGRWRPPQREERTLL